MCKTEILIHIQMWKLWCKSIYMEYKFQVLKLFSTNGSKSHTSKEYWIQNHHHRRPHIYYQGAALTQTTFILSLEYSFCVSVACFSNLHKGRDLVWETITSFNAKWDKKIKLLRTFSAMGNWWGHFPNFPPQYTVLLTWKTHTSRLWPN